MSPTKTDGLDDFFEAVKDIRDRQNIYASGKSLSEMASAHESMRERQRIRDIAQATQESNALLSEKNRIERDRNRLLERQAEEREAERRRIASLPDCPECQAKVDGDRPERCAHCTCRLFWLEKRPIKEKNAQAYLDNPNSCPELGNSKQKLEGVRAALRSAATAFGEESLLGKPTHESLTHFCEKTIAEWETAREAKVRKINEELSATEAAKKTAEDQAAARSLSWFWLELLLLLLSVGAALYLGIVLLIGMGNVMSKNDREEKYADNQRKAAVAERTLVDDDRKVAMWQRQVDELSKATPATAQSRDELRKAKEELRVATEMRERTRFNLKWAKHGSVPQELEKITVTSTLLKAALVAAALYGVWRLIRRTSNAQAAQLSRELEFRNAIARLTARKQEVLNESPPASVRVSQALRDATAALYGSLQNATLLCADWRAMATGCGRLGERDPEPLRSAIQAAEALLEVDLLSLCSGQHATPETLPSRDSQDVGRDVKDTAQKLLQSLCVVAAVDGKLHNDELRMIAAAVRDVGCPLGDEEMRATAVKACQEIYKVGVVEYARVLCREWEPLKGTAFARLVVRLQQQVAAADGRQGSRETQLLTFFQSKLEVT